MNDQDPNIPKSFIGIILIALIILGTTSIIHLRQFSKQERSVIEKMVES
ncbi:MAG: hypothetical protein ACFBSE_25510 [Prochloraceae cyanobacterium]